MLHDVVEDSEWTVESLDAKYGLTAEEQAALRLLSHGHDEDYAACVERVATDPLARPYSPNFTARRASVYVGKSQVTE